MSTMVVAILIGFCTVVKMHICSDKQSITIMLTIVMLDFFSEGYQYFQYCKYLYIEVENGVRGYI